MTAPGFAQRLVRWHKCHGRHELPWQKSRDPYTTWVAEIMLQQTQVATVVPYFERFIARFPDILALARAGEDEVLTYWSGLGYYSRARNLHRAAHLIVDGHGARFPADFDAMLALPGIGRSTAGAVAAFAFGQKRAILDGNVKRVLTRVFAIDGFAGDKAVEAELWGKARELLPDRNIGVYTQALMDLGAMVCRRSDPHCSTCPVRGVCMAYDKGRVAQLPLQKPSRPLPQRSVVMLILHHGAQVLLQKRPPAGIWGGLWSFPELEGGDDIVATCAQRFCAAVEPLSPLPDLHHGFTHFRLRIIPQPVQVLRVRPAACEPGCLWVNLEDAASAPIPAPVRKILGALMHRAPDAHVRVGVSTQNQA